MNFCPNMLKKLFSHGGTMHRYLVDRWGFEPQTLALQTRCSTS